ncbi:MAG TPA: primosomal protein N' [Bacilli bacterium]|nr:primosomal protein N' [Bacilli bacterium]
MFAKVVVDVKSSNVDITYTYRIPEEYHDYISIGSRVLVSFGVREILGYVIAIEEETSYSGPVKDIIDVLDFTKELTLEQVELAKKISEDTKTLMVSSLDLMYPSFLKTKYRKYLHIRSYVDLDADLALTFAGRNKILIDKEIMKVFNKIKKEVEKGNIEISYDNYSYGKNKQIKLYSVNEKLADSFSLLSKKRYDVVSFVSNNPEVNLEDIRENTGCSKDLISSLVTNKHLIYQEVPLVKEFLEEKSPIISEGYTFAEQEVRYKYSRLQKKPFLLYSNDEEFKLKFYLDIVKDALELEKKVFILTPNLITNFELLQYFQKKMVGYRVVNFSSDVSNNEFYDNYINVKNGNFDVIIATKVGLFLPLADLAAIIVIDEGNVNYYSETTPKYSMTEVVKYRADYHQAKLIFATSSPTIEAYYSYFLTKYFLLKHIVPKNYDVRLVNMKEEVGDLLISSVLKTEIGFSLAKKEIVMLILNAKGYSNHLICRNCSNVIKCPICKIGMSYNKKKDEIFCRYCSYKLPKNSCDKCGSYDLSLYAAGLEKVAEILQAYFPQARLLQLDSDTVSDFQSYQTNILKIEDQEVDIILGTNNILTLKNPAIKLIGILDIDRLLNLNDYKATEMTYGLLTDALGDASAKVLVQGYSLDHYAIFDGIKQDFESFYNEEIKYRQEYFYPPFAEANRLIIIGSFKAMYHYANSIKKAFNYLFKTEGVILGPVYLTKYKGVQLIIKHNDFAKLNRIIAEVTENLSQYQLTINYERYPRNFF